MPHAGGGASAPRIAQPPFEDASFDRVLSVFGVRFAPRQRWSRASSSSRAAATRGASRLVDLAERHDTAADGTLEMWAEYLVVIGYKR